MEASPRARSLLRRTLRTCRSHAPLLVALAALVFIPLSLVETLSDRAQDVDADDLSDLEAGGIALLVAVQVASALLGEVFYSGAVTTIITGERTGTRHPLRAIARELPYARLIAVDVLLVLGTFVGILLLVVPGVLFFAYFALAAPVVEIEGAGVRAAFARSRQLVRGHLRTVLGVLVPTVIAIELLIELADAATDEVLGHTLLADWFLAALTNVLLTPLYAVAAVVLAIELVEVKGGRLPGASTPPQ